MKECITDGKPVQADWPTVICAECLARLPSCDQPEFGSGGDERLDQIRMKGEQK